MREPPPRCRARGRLPATTGSADEPARDFAADARRVRGVRAISPRASCASSRTAPEVRWDHPGARLMAVVTNGFLQSRMIRRDWKPGVMHAVIFLGFMALLARKLQLIVIGYDEPFAYPGLAGGLFAAIKDVVELAVLAALAYAFWRRYVQKPERLEANREALLILSLITAIMITDLLFDGFRFALFAGSDPGIAHERDVRLRRQPRRRRAVGAVARGPARPATICRTGSQLVVVFAFLVHPAAGRAFPHRHRAAGAVLPPRPSRQPGAVRSTSRRCMATTPTRQSCASASAPRTTSRGRTASTSSPAPNAAAARTPARRS